MSDGTGQGEQHLSVPAEQTIANRALRGGAFTLGAQAIRLLLNFGATVLLARLLSPPIYGLFGMATFVTGLVALFSEMGMNHATLQREGLSRDELNAAFWINLGVAVVLALSVCAAAIPVGWVYHEPSVSPILMVLSVTLVIAALGSQHQAVLRRQMRLGVVAAADLCGLVGGVVVAVGLAALSFGIWSLVAQQLVQAFISSCVYWLASKWIPGFPRRGGAIAGLLRFGAQLTGFRLVNYLARNLDNALIGWLKGARELGLYSRAYGLFVLPISNINGPIGAVMVPALSRAQNNRELFAKLYLGGLSTVAWITLPLSSLMVAMADPIVPLALGNPWRDVVPLFRLLGISAFGQAAVNTMGWVYTARGEGARMLRWGVFSSTAIVVSFLVGLSRGARGVALCYALTICILVPIGIRFALKGSPIAERDVYRTLAAPAAFSLSAGLLSWAASRLAAGFGAAALGVGVFGSLVLALLLLKTTRRRISNLRMLLTTRNS